MKHVFVIKSLYSLLRGYVHSCIPASLLRSYFLISLLILTSPLFAQTFTPFKPAKFGVDGDISAEERLQGTFTPASSHDWFKKDGITGTGIFDTAETSIAKSQIASGQNYSFSKKMQYHTYSVQDSILMLDGTYSRDYFATSSIGNNSDKTAFLNPSDNNKSYTNPSAWSTAPTGVAIPAKSDLIDTYIHMRRNGTSISESNPSNLFVYFAATTLSTNGDHYLDFELFKLVITYNQLTGVFSNSGPLATGGRSSWEFNADGSIRTFGDMSLSFSFNNTTVSEIAIYLWVPYSVYTSVNPVGFDFVSGSWAGNSSNSGYGYVRISPNPGHTLQAWGTVNQANTAAPAWGTNSSNLGSLANNYFSTQYSTGQLAEAAIDLTSLGIDPALSSDYNRCAPPYIKVLVKSRSSSSFSSTLQDFVTPFAFLNNTEINSPVVLSNHLSCTAKSATLTAANTITGASYHWSTTDGSIVSGHNSTEALINQPGTYTLSSAIYAGCPASTTTLTVNKDGYQPVAQAGQTGALTSNPESYVTLRGGDEIQSNYTTPFGGSQGLLWNWSGPNGFTSSEQNPKASKEGTYQLVVTEKRNGCTDTAIIYVLKATPLPITLKSFSGNYTDNKVYLQWTATNDAPHSYFEVQKNMDGSTYHSIGIVFTAATTFETYSFIDKKIDSDVQYYRLKLVNNGAIEYSKSIRFSKEVSEYRNNIRLLQNPVNQTIVFSYVTAHTGIKKISLIHASGIKIISQRLSMQKGSNNCSLLLPSGAPLGLYILQVEDIKTTHSNNLIKR